MLLVRLPQRDDRRRGRILGHDHHVVGNLLRLVKDAGDGDGFLGLLLLGRIDDRSDVSVRERVCVDDGFGRRVASFVFHGRLCKRQIGRGKRVSKDMIPNLSTPTDTPTLAGHIEEREV